MDHRQWRPNLNPRPIQYQNNLCPNCFVQHFPFCPPPNPNFAYDSDFDRTFKKPRIEDEDERRLKLIRDHGLNPPQFQHPHHAYVTPSLSPPPPPPPPPPHHQFPPTPPPPPPTYHPQQHHSEINAPYHDHNFQFQPYPNHNLNSRELHHPYPYPNPYPNGTTNSFPDNSGQLEGSRFFSNMPPLPNSPPPPLPMDPPVNHFKTYFSQPKKPPSLFPVTSSVSHEPHPLHQPYFHNNKPHLPEISTGYPVEESSKQYTGDAQHFSQNRMSDEKPKFVDASQLFRNPHRTSRPDHFVIILRGFPGSGKSYLAKMLRDLEVENGGDAPRIHSMDDYFMTEVEKVEDNDGSKSSSSGRNKRPVIKKVMEYCYEPEMEEAYRSSMLKAFKKTVEEGVFTFIIVDDRNLRVADFAQFWATAKRSGYEVYILEATYKDPAGCAARNVHGFTLQDIEKMAEQWEEAPSLYLQLDAKSLFHGDDLKENRIQEVDMDMDDDLDDALVAAQGREADKAVDPPVKDDGGSIKDMKRWDAEEEHPTKVRELGKSKWSEDFGEDDIDQTEGMKGNINALSGLIHQYGKERKSVHWGDKAGKTGFSIGTARKVNALSLVIGPGAGYNLKSNPLPEVESRTQNSAEPKKHSKFQERIRAEHESFKAVFDGRRPRIGLNVEED
ncbi:P-loop containing nucleoside triphosphate hydrolase superfamily protein [Trifolium repens]|nr:P-loop containing nucleoside triphosphate hydrolase superfamily protein [Trifolium repens]